MDIDRKPDFINEEGTKWWVDVAVISYLKEAKLIDYKAYIIETKDNYKTRVLINSDDIIEFETPKLEDMGVHIDMLKLAAVN